MKPETVRRRSPLSWVPTVYFAMGLPFILVNMVSTLMFRGLGIDDARIALWTSLIILPWSLKPIWSPLMEMFRTKKFWVVSTQLISGLGLALTALTLPLPDFFPYAVALMGVIAFSGATHDIATDGVYITELSKDQQARFIGWQGAFYNIAKVFAMGGLVYLAGALKERVGIVEAWMIVMALCGASCWESTTCGCCLRAAKPRPMRGASARRCARRAPSSADSSGKGTSASTSPSSSSTASPRGWSSRSFRCFSTPRSTIRVSA